jgi:hypothetical protein
MSQTRRLEAILTAIVAGYSRLIGADEGEEIITLGDRPQKCPKNPRFSGHSAVGGCACMVAIVSQIVPRK